MKLPVIEGADFKYAIDSFQVLQQEATVQFAAEHDLEIDDKFVKVGKELEIPSSGVILVAKEFLINYRVVS